MKRLNIQYIIYVFALCLILFGCESNKSTGPQTDEYATVSIVVMDEYGRSIVGAKVTSNPPTEEIITDSEGRAIFENLLVREYTFYIRRLNFPIFNKTIIPDPKSSEDVLFLINSEPPEANILYPKTNNFISIYEIRFKGEGTDPEDGALPDSVLVWYSDIDGEIGRGEELVLDILTPGNHTITLEVTDLDKKKDTASIEVTLADYRTDNYFPMPFGARWLYTHQTNKFSITNTSGNIENWELFNITVEIDEDKVRTSTMQYKVKEGNRTRECRYTIADHFEIEGDNIYVKKTTENLLVWEGNPYGSPDAKLDLSTSYQPHYTLIENVLAPNENSTYENNILTSVTWSYIDPFFGPKEFTEHFNITTSVTIGEEENINTGRDEFAVIPITISEEGSTRKWWLAKGIGIVRLEYNSFSYYPVADLATTNLANTSAQNSSFQKIIPGYIPQESLLLNTDPVPADNCQERLMALRKILKNLSPR